MALVKPSGTISDIRGKLGGTIFANSGAGLVVRSFTSPVNRNTIRQNNQRIIINSLQQEWKLLTNAQRACWRNWIQLNPIQQNNFNRLPINAQQAFIKVNVPRRLYGHNIIKDPVFIPFLYPSLTFSMSLVGGVLFLDSTRALDNTREFIELFCTVVLPQSVNSPGTIFRSLLFATANSNAQDVSTAYTDVFGILPVVGQKIFFRVRNIDLVTGLNQGFQQESFTFV